MSVWVDTRNMSAGVNGWTLRHSLRVCFCQGCSLIFFNLNRLWRRLRRSVPRGSATRVGSAIKYLALGVTRPLLGLSFPVHCVLGTINS